MESALILFNGVADTLEELFPVGRKRRSLLRYLLLTVASVYKRCKDDLDAGKQQGHLTAILLMVSRKQILDSKGSTIIVMPRCMHFQGPRGKNKDYILVRGDANDNGDADDVPAEVTFSDLFGMDIATDFPEIDPERNFMFCFKVTKDGTEIGHSNMCIPQDPEVFFGPKWNVFSAELDKKGLGELNLSGDPLLGQSALCLGCMAMNVKLKMCSRCQLAYYCSPECQKLDYARHKEDCKKIAGRRNEGGSDSNGSSRTKVKSKKLVICSLPPGFGLLAGGYASAKAAYTDFQYKLFSFDDIAPHIVEVKHLQEPLKSKNDVWKAAGIGMFTSSPQNLVPFVETMAGQYARADTKLDLDFGAE